VVFRRWHESVRRAISDLARGHGYRELLPCRVYYRGEDGRRVFYSPDNCWIYGRKRIGLVVWEVETSFNAKHILGGIALGAFVTSKRAEIYTYQDEYGETFRKPIVFRSVYDLRRKEVLRPDVYMRLRPSEACFVLVTPDIERADYVRRYLELAAGRRPKWFEHAEAIACTPGAEPAVKKSLRLNRRLSWLWD